MNQKEKDLLFKDLCARLPYHPKVEITFGNTKEIKTFDSIHLFSPPYASLKQKKYEVKPFLRSMSSMTEEEEQIRIIYERDIMSQGFGAVRIYMSRYINWLNSNHFDWRTDGNNKTLIENGLAIKVTKENNPYK